MKKCFQATALFAVALAASFLQAYAVPNLSGEWKLNTSKSNYGPVPAPDVMTRTIKHNEPVIEYTTYQKGQAGEQTTNLKYTTDGTPTTNKLPTGEAKGSAKWDGDKLIVDSTRTLEGGVELKFHETWTLSPDGKMLTVVNHLTAPQGEFDLTLVFDKQ